MSRGAAEPLREGGEVVFLRVLRDSYEAVPVKHGSRVRFVGVAPVSYPGFPSPHGPGPNKCLQVESPILCDGLEGQGTNRVSSLTAPTFTLDRSDLQKHISFLFHHQFNVSQQATTKASGGTSGGLGGQCASRLPVRLVSHHRPRRNPQVASHRDDRNLPASLHPTTHTLEQILHRALNSDCRPRRFD